MVTLYEIFDVPETAKMIEIKRAYKKLAVEYHPDKVASTNDSELQAKAEYELIKINNAKDILLDPIKRADYDSLLQELRSKEHVDDQNIIIEISENENIEVEWESEPSLFEPEPEEQNFEPEARSEDTISYEEILKINRQAAEQPPREPAPDFSNIQRRFLTFCPRCGEENLSGGPSCHLCDTSLVVDDFRGISKDSFRPEPRPEPSQVPRQVPRQVPSQVPRQEPGQVSPGSVPPAPPRSPCPRCGALNPRDRENCYNCNANMMIEERFINRDQEIDQEYDDSEYFECPHCGAENLDNSGYCNSCYGNLTYHKNSITFPPNGERQDLRENIQDYYYQSCPKCGAKNRIGLEICQNCNELLIEHQEYIPPQERPENLQPIADQDFETEVNRFRKCPRCGSFNSFELEYCQQCNMNLIYYREFDTDSANSYDYENIPIQAPQIDNTEECPHCGTKNSIDNQFCDSCFGNLAFNRNPSIPNRPHTNVKPEVEVRDIDLQRCPHCGSIVYVDDNICHNCGVRFLN